MVTKLKSSFDYHTALKLNTVVKNEDIDKELDFFEKDGSVVFAWDLLNGVNGMFFFADAVYSEISWKFGYDVFAERAGKSASKREWEDYVKQVKFVIDVLGVPSFIVGGKSMRRFFGDCKEYNISFLNDEAIIFLFNGAELPVGLVDNNAVIDFVTFKFDRVLDFSCGYGNVAKSALENGKRFVCSDFNKRCVYRLAKNYMGFND